MKRFKQVLEYILVSCCLWVAYFYISFYLISDAHQGPPSEGIAWIIIGAVFGISMVFTEPRLNKVLPQSLSSLIAGTLGGVVIAFLGIIPLLQYGLLAGEEISKDLLVSLMITIAKRTLGFAILGTAIAAILHHTKPLRLHLDS